MVVSRRDEIVLAESLERLPKNLKAAMAGLGRTAKQDPAPRSALRTRSEYLASLDPG